MKTQKEISRTFAAFPKVANQVLATKNEETIKRWMEKLKPHSLRIIRQDPYLEPYGDAILGRYKYQFWKEHELTMQSNNLSEMASGYLYFGLHYDKKAQQWLFREWAPNATQIFLVGTFNDWKELPQYELKRLGDNGIWEICLPQESIHHQDLYKLKIYWEGGCGERIPS